MLLPFALSLLLNCALVYTRINWDYLVMVHQWAPTLCLFMECTKKPVLNKFTIHGLWAERWPSIKADNCAPVHAFQAENIADIHENLSQFWPDFLHQSSSHKFWRHEWKKHGRCVVENDLIRDQSGYFRVSLELWNRTPVLDALQSAGIVPTDNVKYKVICENNTLAILSLRNSLLELVILI
ncbi:unnamed protein product [Calicophoron daubneyi]|uniref:Uncharacterized protein n=1 Tax=Calicophoron daubneyi TaxID=300641 RepID=A0AAV2TSL7_CALDB